MTLQRGGFHAAADFSRSTLLQCRIVLALFLLRDVSWISMPILGFTIVIAQMGLLMWEAKYVSLTLAAPGLRPAGPGPAGDQ